MSKHIYQVVEYVGSSTVGHDDAIRNAIGRASREHANLRWFQVVESRGHIDNGAVAHWQVILKVGATLPDDEGGAPPK